MSRPRAVACAFAATAAMGLGACGDGSSDEDVREAMQTYLDAVATGDADQGCAVLTARARRRFVGEWAGISRARSCRAAFTALTSGSGSDLVRRAARRARPGRVEVDGDTATVRLTGNDRPVDLRLRREDGAWRVDETHAG